MIRIINYTRLLMLALSAGILYGCSFETNEQRRSAESRYLRINGYPKGFSEIDVSTRSGKNEFETKLSTLYMLIFDAEGQLVDVPQFVASGVPNFLIDTQSPSFINHDQQALQQCDIFLIGNLNNGDLAGIQTLTELSNFEVEATTIHPDADPSFKGLIMIGKTQDKVDLSRTRPSTSSNIQDIAMVSIYAKVVVNLQIRPGEHLPGNDQSFRMTSWEVVNAPRYATLGAPDADKETVPSHNDKIPSSPSRLYSGSNPVGVSQSLSYTFYMLEHKRNKVNSITYPTGIDELSKQRFKPKLVNEDTDAAYMILNGIYVDHQQISHETTYKLYLGANAIDDFYILRDNQYNNNITIKGVTSNNGYDESTISFDARVTVNSGPVVVSVKRDTQLDSHYEVRPLDIYVTPGYTVNVAVDAEAQSWIGLDRETMADGKVVKRDYFTTNLISTLPKSYGPFTSDFRVWAYFDENASTADRLGKIIFTYTETATGNQTVLTYTFLQKGLFEVTTKEGNTYYIEFHEEYLHNFDPNDLYNNTMDGMSWGLDSMQLSHQKDAFKFDGFLSDDVNSGIRKLLREKYGAQFYLYDFYTPLDESKVGTNGVTINTRAGHTFTRDIVSTAGIGPLKLNEKVKSAVEYCYNKNKRNSSGVVTEIKWYLPAIDEIEDIVKEAYGTFTDFQNKYYWASQPAYDYYTYRYGGLAGINAGNGEFFNDNLYSARATKVYYEGSKYKTVDSGMSSFLIHFNFRRVVPWPFGSVVWGETPQQPNPVTPVDDPGKQPRTNINRIRCVYKTN